MVDVAVITGYGLNTDYESEEAFRLTGADPVRIHINDLISGKNSLENYQIMMVPGGFSYGDHLGSGKVLANKFRFNLRDDLKRFIEADKLIIGVCNGFQILVKMGILPALEGEYFSQSVTITYNKSGQFESRWVSMKANQTSPCIWTKNLITPLDAPVRHGEGQFIPMNEAILQKLWDRNLVVFTYDPNTYPNNPNGSTDGIAGICNESGLIFGMMPHPECHLIPQHHPQWARNNNPDTTGLVIFKNAVEYAKKNL
ncbi:MAG: phosphoribosylformylglycinamidine synthase subunit PurQ [Promethearchaeota archaeon]|nr:MAG: phosphoribosylformylglycinamidine synthase subunit PurQ [Candidatus Lokiarchaeota archaeon]